MKSDKKIEILSPSGSFEAAKAAVSAGCDAIYMGGSRFGARAYAESAIDSDKEILKTIKYVKENGRKIYLTVNTLLKKKELKELLPYTDKLVDAGIDAFIIQDFGVAKLLKDRYKDIPLHASTQMTICSLDGVKFVEQFGFKRVVLARELSLREIELIRKNTDIEIEVFVHGSMCYSYSGACLMSSFIGGQSGNRGRCKGPCRHEYKIQNDNKKGTKAEYILSMKDMCVIEYLDKLKEIGADSLKIEGRMRKPLYVAGVTYMYRKYLDKDYNVTDISKDKKFLQEIYDKGGFTTYFDKHNGKDMMQLTDREKRVPDKEVTDFITKKFLI